MALGTVQAKLLFCILELAAIQIPVDRLIVQTLAMLSTREIVASNMSIA